MARLAAINKLHPPLGAQWMGQITQRFGIPNNSYPTTKHHVGVDIAVPVGEPIYAPADGETVAVFKNNPVLGNACYFYFTYKGVKYTTRFLHQAYVPRIGRFKKGDILGYTGNSGQSTAPHLHFDQCIGTFDLTGINASNFRTKFVDPLTFL